MSLNGCRPDQGPLLLPHALQAQRCPQPGCRGWLLEQRPDNLHAGDAWACTACSASVPSHSISGRGPQDVADALSLRWRQAVADMRIKV